MLRYQDMCPKWPSSLAVWSTQLTIKRKAVPSPSRPMPTRKVILILINLFRVQVHSSPNSNVYILAKIAPPQTTTSANHVGLVNPMSLSTCSRTRENVWEVAQLDTLVTTRIPTCVFLVTVLVRLVKMRTRQTALLVHPYSQRNFLVRLIVSLTAQKAISRQLMRKFVQHVRHLAPIVKVIKSSVPLAIQTAIFRSSS